MKQTTIKYIFVAVFIMAFAAVSAAQATLTPYVNMDFSSTGVHDAGGDEILGTTHTAIRIGAEAVIGNGLEAYGEAAYAFGGDIRGFGISVPVEKNTKLGFNAGVRYALYSQGSFSVGPVIDYGTTTWKISESGDEMAFSASGFGAGLFAAMNVDDLKLSASYIHRFNANYRVEDPGVTPHTETGGGNKLAVSGAYTLTDQVALTASYARNNEYVVTEEGPNKGAKFASLGFSLGMRFTF